LTFDKNLIVKLKDNFSYLYRKYKESMNNLSHDAMIGILDDQEIQMKDLSGALLTKIINEKISWEDVSMVHAMRIFKENDTQIASLEGALHQSQDEVAELNQKIEFMETVVFEDAKKKIADLKNELEIKEAAAVRISELAEQRSEIIIELQKKKPRTKKTDEEKREENEIMMKDKESNFNKWMSECCKWTKKITKQRCPLRKTIHEIAPTSCIDLNQSFREWAVYNKIIDPKTRKQKRIPDYPLFKEWVVREHKAKEWTTWCVKDEQYPHSPNGSHKTPRVNLKIVRSPEGIDLFKN
jgi:predicted RNA-binding protein with RPS1 domain